MLEPRRHNVFSSLRLTMTLSTSSYPHAQNLPFAIKATTLVVYTRSESFYPQVQLWNEISDQGVIGNGVAVVDGLESRML